MTGLGGKLVWTMTYAQRPHSRKQNATKCENSLQIPSAFSTRLPLGLEAVQSCHEALSPVHWRTPKDATMLHTTDARTHAHRHTQTHTHTHTCAASEHTYRYLKSVAQKNMTFKFEQDEDLKLWTSGNSKMYCIKLKVHCHVIQCFNGDFLFFFLE